LAISGAQNQNFSVTENSQVVCDLNATGSSEPVFFKIVSGYDSDLFEINATSGALFFKEALSFETKRDLNNDNTYDVAIQASSTSGLSRISVISVSVNNLEEIPVITSDNGGADVSLMAWEDKMDFHKIVAHDPDLVAISYSISGGHDQSQFVIDQNTGVISFATEVTFEDPQDHNADNIYEVKVRASDPAGNFAEQNLTVTLNRCDERIFIKNLQRKKYVAYPSTYELIEEINISQEGEASFNLL